MACGATFDITKELLSDVYDLARRRHLGKFGYRVVPFLPLLFLALSTLWITIHLYAWAFLLIFLTILMAATNWYQKKQVLSKALAPLAKTPNRRVTHRYEETQLTVEGPFGDSRIAWEAFTALVQGKKVWLLSSGSVYTYIPTTALDDEAKEFLTRKIAEVGGRVEKF
jgi:hypothetical protein